jgi:hypothetical protein
MQISRHWRMNSLRYRLQGVRLQNGQVSLQARPTQTDEHPQIAQRPVQQTSKNTVSAA